MRSPMAAQICHFYLLMPQNPNFRKKKLNVSQQKALAVLVRPSLCSQGPRFTHKALGLLTRSSIYSPQGAQQLEVRVGKVTQYWTPDYFIELQFWRQWQQIKYLSVISLCNEHAILLWEESKLHSDTFSPQARLIALLQILCCTLTATQVKS